MKRLFYRLALGCVFQHSLKQEYLGIDADGARRTRYTCVRCPLSYVMVRKPGEPWPMK